MTREPWVSHANSVFPFCPFPLCRRRFSREKLYPAAGAVWATRSAPKRRVWREKIANGAAKPRNARRREMHLGGPILVLWVVLWALCAPRASRAADPRPSRFLTNAKKVTVSVLYWYEMLRIPNSGKFLDRPQKGSNFFVARCHFGPLAVPSVFRLRQCTSGFRP